MKKLIAGLFFLACCMQAQANIIDFTGEYDVTNWTQSASGGNIDISNAPSSITLTTADTGSGTSNTDFSISVVASAAGTISFDWFYTTQDVDGSEFDPFGWLLNGIFTQVTVDGLFQSQSGTVSLDVLAGDVFGFRAFAVDSALGSSTTTISNFSVITASVPEPTTLAVLGLGLLGLGGMSRRKS